MPTVYADYNASTPLDPRVFEAMREWYLGPPSNAGSRTHIFGQRAKAAVDLARVQIAQLLNAEPEEICFTSGATESNNMALLGVARSASRLGRKHIISTTIEHRAVLEPLEYLGKHGFDVELAPVTRGGFVEPATIQSLLRPETILVSVMHANNETGVKQPIAEIAKMLADTNILFHTDAAQTFGKEVVELQDCQADLTSISGHKIYGPQGIGALCVRRKGNLRRPLEPITFGGGQERGLRPGTVPVALAVGLGEAARLAAAEFRGRAAVCENIRAELLSAIEGVAHSINGDISRALPNVMNISFSGVDGEALMMALRDHIAMSNGSACTSVSYKPSHVLVAMGLESTQIESSLRISWGPGISRLPVEALVAAVKELAA
jgi:cysteine desulfurase